MPSLIINLSAGSLLRFLRLRLLTNSLPSMQAIAALKSYLQRPCVPVSDILNDDCEARVHRDYKDAAVQCYVQQSAQQTPVHFLTVGADAFVALAFWA